jgi:hypothetical protein
MFLPAAVFSPDREFVTVGGLMRDMGGGPPKGTSLPLRFAVLNRTPAGCAAASDLNVLANQFVNGRLTIAAALPR